MIAEKDDRLGFDTVAFAVGGRDGVGSIENLAFGLRTRVPGTTLAGLPATINTSIMLIALPDVLRGIDVNPLRPGNGSRLLWLIMG